MDANYHSVREMRASLDRVMDRAKDDADFGSRFDSDPDSVLSEAGLSSEAVSEISSEIGSIRSGGHKLEPHRMCDYTTCWITMCNHWGTFITGKD